MPGKVNPVIPESVLMVAAQVVGNDATITLAGMSGHFDLNVMMPLIAYNLLQSIEILASSSRLLAEKCVDGIQANRERCEELVERSLAMVTALVPKIGYDAAAEIAKESVRTGRTVRELVREKKLLSEAELAELAAGVAHVDHQAVVAGLEGALANFSHKKDAHRLGAAEAAAGPGD